MFQEKIFKIHPKIGCRNISPNSKKIKKEKESYIFIVYNTFNITSGGLLVFLDGEKDIGSTKNGHF